jgi:hypothetical protein
VKMPKMGVFHVGTRQVHNWTLPVLIRLFSISSKTKFYRVSRVGVAWRAAAGDTRVGSGGGPAGGDRRHPGGVGAGVASASTDTLFWLKRRHLWPLTLLL